MRWIVKTIGASWIVNCFSAKTGFLHLSLLRQQDHPLGQGHSLFAFVFVRAFEVVDGNELPQRVADTVHTENVDTQVKDAVQRVAVVIAFSAGDTRSQPTSEYLMHPSRLSKLGVEFPKSTGLSHRRSRTKGHNARWISMKT